MFRKLAAVLQTGFVNHATSTLEREQSSWTHRAMGHFMRDRALSLVFSHNEVRHSKA